MHIHSCLSPCADLDMSPRAIVEKSLEMGMDIIAVCDHNSAENVGATIRAGVQNGLFVLPGIEINSKEEVHTLAIFENEKQALSMQDIIYRHLKGINRPEIFGEQVVANEFDEVEGFNDRMLIGSSQLGLQEVVKEVRRLGGLSIACHVDRPSFSIVTQLGFIPPDLGLDALEVSRSEKLERIREEVPEANNLAMIVSSDAHFLDDLGRQFTTFAIESPSWDEMRKAFRSESGRKVRI